MRTKSLQNKKINVITLGCSKNLVDSENLITQLRANDLNAEHEQEGEADVIVVNTCGFIDKAKEESVNTILHYAEAKKAGSIEKLYVTGCLSERYKDDLIKEIPEVDAFFGTMELPGLLAKFEVDYKHELIGERISMTPPHYAYLKISEGCNRTCSFCAIPLMRNKHISRSIEDLVQEAKNLAARGVQELILIAQELTYYGLDLYKERALPQLLKELAKVEGIEWIRCHYAYPSKFPREILEVMRDEKSVCNYLDIPLQHASDPVLKIMKRQITQAEMQDLLDYAREIIPDICLRTTMLVGHPGETEEDFEELKRFVQHNKFDRLGVFQYSHEEGTSAYDLEDDIPDSVKIDRTNQLMAIQAEISEEKNLAKIGKTFKTIIDRKEGESYYGRTVADSPEVDNEVIINIDNQYLRLGSFVNVKITDALAYDLIGVVVKE